MKGTHRPELPKQRSTQKSYFRATFWLLLSSPAWLFLAGIATQAQTDKSIQKQEDQLIRQYTPSGSAPVYRLPKAAPAPVYRPPAAPAPRRSVSEPAAEPAPAPRSAPASAPSQQAEPATAAKPAANLGPLSRYEVEFNRSPVVGNALQLRGAYSEARFGFTRPRDWNVQAVKALIRFKHSPALLANRSNLTVRVNGVSVGSTPLNRRSGQIGQLLVSIPPRVLQNYNEVTLVAQQNNSPECPENPGDPTLWTEVLPDSKVMLDFRPVAVPLDLSNYPYPFFDSLSLDTNRIAYLTPEQPNEAWLTSMAQFQAGLGRLADFRPLETRLFKKLEEVPLGQRLVVIGTPAEQTALRGLKLPLQVVNNQLVDESKTPLAEDVGVLMLGTTRNGQVPVLVVTGNGPEGVSKAVQLLVQADQRKLTTGQYMTVSEVPDVPSPSPRSWPRFIPANDSFKLSDLMGAENKAMEDVTVRGAYSPPVEFNFRALPDDRLKRGSTMTLRYSHSPQVNPRLSTLEVRIDGVPIGGKRLTKEDGVTKDTFKLDLPPDLIKPDSKMQVVFNLTPKELGQCQTMPDQQLWGTVHSDTSFDLQRENAVQLPDLGLLKAGYPFAAPQDLSTTAIAVPDAPNAAELQTLLEFSERLGRLSQSDTVKLRVYTAGTLPEDVRQESNLVGIGRRERFPFPEINEAKGFQLGNFFTRSNGQSQVQTAPDTGGVVKQVVSPWNNNRVLLALTAQDDAGLGKVQDLFERDVLFFQLKDDTVVVNTTKDNPSPYDPDDYSFESFREADRTRQIENTSPVNKVSNFLSNNWYLLPTGIILAALGMYGVAQLYLKRLAVGDKK